MKHLIYYILLIGLLQACNLSKEVDIELPTPDPMTVVECYLEPGEPYRLLLTTNQSFFADFPQNLVEYYDSISIDGAQVKITRDNEEIILDNELEIDSDFLKIYNYTSSRIVPYDTISTFELEIVLPDGNIITSETKILPIVTIDSVVVEPEELENVGSDSLRQARILTYVTDNPNELNFYRRMFNWNSLVDSIPEQDFTTDDQILESESFVFGTGYFYNNGDTIYNTIFHMSEEYYDYQTSIFNSIDANFNPFATPGLIESNVRGEGVEALGIFTGLSYDRVTTILDFE